MVYNYPGFFYNQLCVSPPMPAADQIGKTIIITGSNTGLGKEAVRHFVRLNAAKVIIACRSLQKGENARANIEASTGRKGVIEVWPLDLANYDSVKEFAARCSTIPRIDTVIENAGIASRQYTAVAGNESTITVNVVSTFLLALLLLPIMRASGERNNITPTLTIVSSTVHHWTPFPEQHADNIFDALNDPKSKTMGNRYETSKLLEVFVCRELARLQGLKQTKVTLNFVCPGFCHSELTREMEGDFSMKMMKKLLAKTAEEGSRPLFHAGAVAGPSSHGKWLSDCKIKKCAPIVEGKDGLELQKRIWGELKVKLEGIEKGVTRAF